MRRRATAASAALLLAGVLLTAIATTSTSAQGAVYACPMHPDVTSATPGVCPRCRMTLVLTDPFDAREYIVDVETTPRAVRAGAPFRLRLTVRDPETLAPVKTFATVHDKQFHLFVVSQDLEHYAHIHPEEQPDGSWTIAATVPRPGYYKLYSDFLPIGGTPQVIAAPFVTAGFRGDLVSASATLTPDRTWTKTFDGLRTELVLPDAGLIAGREEAFALQLTDAQTGAPVKDIEPYLAAWGHTLLMSEDTIAVVHAHPVELVPEHDPTARGGPIITFKAMFPKAGRYRLWTQMQRLGRITTAMYTVDVASPVRQ